MDDESRLWRKIRSVHECKSRDIVLDFLHANMENAYHPIAIIKSTALKRPHVIGALEGGAGGMESRCSLVSQGMVSRELSSQGPARYRITPPGIAIVEFLTGYYEYRENAFLGSSLWHYWLRLKVKKELGDLTMLVKEFGAL